ncbi:hypothetical protein B0H13DRAFT_2336978 [Mycena leptocephala]|nr:hypothetical protein B0H13DRAFT_2336978 [Mycena leptocephala]
MSHCKMRVDYGKSTNHFSLCQPRLKPLEKRCLFLHRALFDDNSSGRSHHPNRVEQPLRGEYRDTSCGSVLSKEMLGQPPKSNLGPKVFFIWASTAALSVTFAYFMVSETKGLSLEQVDQMLTEC